MRIEIICAGDEVLTGKIVDSHFSYARAQRPADGHSPEALSLLRQGMLALLARARGATAYFAHPFAWAAFFVAGDGGPAR